MDPYVTGAVVKQLREKNRLTQAELAGRLGVSDKTVSKWETGRGYPDISLLGAVPSPLMGRAPSFEILAVYLSSDGHSLVLTVSYQNNWPPPVYPGCRKSAWKSEKFRARGNDVISGGQYADDH